MTKTCFVINVIILITYIIIYWDVIVDRTKRKKMSVSSKKIFIISVAVGIIALMVSVVNLFELDM